MRLLGTLLVLSAAVLAQTPDLKTASGYPKMVQKQVTVWLERVAAKMPEEEHAFNTGTAVRSCGQILGHVADANYTFCAGALGEAAPASEIEKTKDRKSTRLNSSHLGISYAV